MVMLTKVKRKKESFKKKNCIEVHPTPHSFKISQGKKVLRAYFEKLKP